jgi:pimeloyl-ACP methyl ester carboxylesterase
MSIRVLAAVFSVVAVLVTGCSSGTGHLQVNSIDVAGPGTLGLSAEGVDVTAIAVYFHGMDQDEQVAHSDEKHTRLTEALLRDGYAVVAASAGGNAFANPASMQSYRDLISNAKIKYGTDRVVFIAESMGGLPALNLLGDPGAGNVDTMVGISPIMGMPLGARSLDFVMAAWDGTAPPDSADPMSWPVDKLAGDRFRLLTGLKDDVIPPGATAEDFLERYRGTADIELSQCEGGHVADGCFDADGIVAWLKGTRA